MHKRLGTTLLLAALLAASAEAKDTGTTPFRMVKKSLDRGVAGASGVTGLSAGPFVDTVSYGGTFWAADSGRWEAMRDEVWTFDSGVGSAFGPTGPNKPSGYHTRMEGWYGLDFTLNPLPYFRRSTTCAINGSFSFWAGVTPSEASDLCYAAGQGYGNAWTLEITKSFAYPGSGNVSFSYKYAIDAEPGYDYAYVYIDTTGNGDADDVLLEFYTGTVSGTESITLNPGADMRSSAGSFTLKFVASSDGSYSDEDGLYGTVCGLMAVDDVTLSGAVVDLATFEAGANGWSQTTQTTGVGDYTNIVHSDDLPPPTTFCPCGLADSVLVFFDELEGHPLDQFNFAVSPWIDLNRGGDAGRPGKLLIADIYAEMPVANYVFEFQKIRWYPYVCPANGSVITSPFVDQNTVFYYGEAPFCNPQGTPVLTDYSGIVDAAAEQVQLAWGVLSLCRTSPFGPVCTGVSNTTPWLDNLSLGVYGTTTAPTLVMETFDFLQDNFAEDGTLNPGSTGRFDTAQIKNAAIPGSGSILGDTLYVAGDGGNTEVRFVFRVTAGPFTSPGALAAYASQWTAEPGIGPGWYSARMDTAEQGGLNLSGAWMSTFHESDPGFQGTDRSADPNDPSQLENEILPDHILTPGSRVDYFLAARYTPGDPRNPGGSNWFVLPDTSGENYFEAEILPSSVSSDSSWNCTLYVDHHHDRELADQAIIETGLNTSLGLGSNNFEGTRFDRLDVQAPSSNQFSFGRPLDTNWGASIIQTFAYKNILFFSGTLDANLITPENAANLGPWLLLPSIGGNRFYGSGDLLATSMELSGEGGPTQFLRTTLGTLLNCDTIRDVGCPAGTGLDSTFCLPAGAVGGAHFALAGTNRIRGNGCPNLRSYDLVDVNPSVSSARGNVTYIKEGSPRQFASVTNHNTVNVDYKTVLDGFQIGRLRSNPGYFLNGCDDATASYNRMDAILDWFGTAASCELPTAIVGVPVGGGPGVPGFRHALGQAYPNPMNPTTRIQFTNGVANGKVTLEIFDVTGRRVKTLVDAALPAGVHEVTWDGTSENGNPVSSGMYFYRMHAGDFVSAKKLVVTK